VSPAKPHSTGEFAVGITSKNVVVSAIAALFIAGFFVFIQLRHGPATIQRAEHIRLSEILANPAKYDGADVSVTGYLFWHPDEPTLFVDEHAAQELEFEQSITLEMLSKLDFQLADRKPVVVFGTFGFDPEYRREHVGYKGVFQVRTISVAGADSGN